MAAPMVMALSHTRFLTNRVNIFIDASQRCCVHRTASSLKEKELSKPSTAKPSSSNKALQISKAMKSYLETAKRSKLRMNELTEEYKTGKRHLANIMGIPPNQMTNEDVNNAVRYLMPSGLTGKTAKPALMKAEQVTAYAKPAQFGLDGRPHHYMFYTGKPHYFELMHKIASRIVRLQQKERQNYIDKKDDGKDDINADLPNTKKLKNATSEWIDQKMLEKSVSEPVSKKDHDAFCALMEHLLSHPLSLEEDKFISKYRVTFKQRHDVKSRSPSVDADGRKFQLSHGTRKSARCSVKVIFPGTGKFDIHGQDLLYFSRLSDREQIMFPLQLSDMTGKVDVKVDILRSGGPTGEAGAVRVGLANALLSFVTQDVADKLMIAGLLTIDPRHAERKKPGKEGARKRYTWKKR